MAVGRIFNRLAGALDVAANAAHGILASGQPDAADQQEQHCTQSAPRMLCGHFRLHMPDASPSGSASIRRLTILGEIAGFAPGTTIILD